MKKIYKWMEDCIVVKGYVRSCIYDLTREKTYFVDQNTSALIQKIESYDSHLVEKNLNPTELEWFHFFIKKEFLFEIPVSQVKNFTKIPIDWHNSSKIICTIIENSSYLAKTLKFLNELNCHHIVLSFQNSNEIREVMEKYFKSTFLKSLDIIVEKNEYSNRDYKSLLEDYPLLVDIFINKSTIKLKLNNQKDFRRILNINLLPKNKLTFVMNTDLFMESHFYNVYLNRKLFIDKKGNIFNTIENDTVLGNINNISLAEDLYQLSKTKEWNSKKSNTYICEDCEFRNMCIDNRIPVYSEIHNKWHHETECDYNPYIGLWKGEEGHRSLNDCGVEMSENDLKIDKTKLDSINKVLWDNDN